ncbi:MAG: hypothetical protein WAU49_11645 [Steroidobacteraceae bacterium]
MLSVSGKSLLIAFWLAFLMAGVSVALPKPLSAAFGGVAQLALATIWIGYPISLFYYLANRNARAVGVSLLVCGALLGYVLSVFGYSENAGLVRGRVVPLLGAVLIAAPFVAGAFALKKGEKAASAESKIGIIATAVALFALPFFGAYIHERVRRVHCKIDAPWR